MPSPPRWLMDMRNASEGRPSSSLLGPFILALGPPLHQIPWPRFAGVTVGTQTCKNNDQHRGVQTELSINGVDTDIVVFPAEHILWPCTPHYVTTIRKAPPCEKAAAIVPYKAPPCIPYKAPPCHKAAAVPYKYAGPPAKAMKAPIPLLQRVECRPFLRVKPPPPGVELHPQYVRPPPVYDHV